MVEETMTKEFDTTEGSDVMETSATNQSVPCTGSALLAQECAEAICDEWSVGNERLEFHDVWFDKVSVEAVAERLKPILERAMRQGTSHDGEVR